MHGLEFFKLREARLDFHRNRGFDHVSAPQQRVIFSTVGNMLSCIKKLLQHLKAPSPCTRRWITLLVVAVPEPPTLLSSLILSAKTAFWIFFPPKIAVEDLKVANSVSRGWTGRDVLISFNVGLKMRAGRGVQHKQGDVTKQKNGTRELTIFNLLLSIDHCKPIYKHIYSR